MSIRVMAVALTLVALGVASCTRRDRPSSSSSSEILVPDDLEVTLPPGWIEQPNPGGPKEYRATTDGSTGILQVSKLQPENYDFVARQKDLATFAIDLGRRLGEKGLNWGTPAASKQGNCAMGRYGFATFTGGEFPAMYLWVTVSNDSAFMWTWLGPQPASPAVEQATKVVLEARQRAR